MYLSSQSLLTIIAHRLPFYFHAENVRHEGQTSVLKFFQTHDFSQGVLSIELRPLDNDFEQKLKRTTKAKLLKEIHVDVQYLRHVLDPDPYERYVLDPDPYER